MPPLAKYYVLFVPGSLLASAFPLCVLFMGSMGWLVHAAGFVALFATFAIRCPGCSNRIVALPPDSGSWKICDQPQRHCRFCGRDLLGKNNGHYTRTSIHR
jgi:hypothetical protein